MDITKQYQEQQEAKHLQSRISSFIGDYQIGTLLNRCGIRKLRGVSPLVLFSAIFQLPFEGNNFFRGIVKNTSLPFKKNAAYDLLKNPRHNWRRFLLFLAVQVANFFSRLTNDEREKVLIFDDSTYDRSRSKAVELLAWIFDHNSRTSLKGFKLLTLGWCPMVPVFCRWILSCAPPRKPPRDCSTSGRFLIKEPADTNGDWKPLPSPLIILKTW